jgi:SAM-dependent methyltransferase
MPGLVADLAGGTGYYLAGILDALPHRHGACIDLSVPALRRAARAHPRAAALGADVWQPLPLADRSAALVVSIFGPRNAAETGRILIPGGTLIIATPGAGQRHTPGGNHGWESHQPPGSRPGPARWTVAGGVEGFLVVPAGRPVRSTACS